MFLQVKVWNTSSGFCFVTFTEHLGGITGVVFNQNGQVVLSSSLDGSVRAFDLNRYSYAPNFEKVDGAYCFWSVRAWVGGCVTLFVPTVTFKPLKLES